MIDSMCRPCNLFISTTTCHVYFSPFGLQFHHRSLVTLGIFSIFPIVWCGTKKIKTRVPVFRKSSASNSWLYGGLDLASDQQYSSFQKTWYQKHCGLTRSLKVCPSRRIATCMRVLYESRFCFFARSSYRYRQLARGDLGRLDPSYSDFDLTSMSLTMTSGTLARDHN